MQDPERVLNVDPQRAIIMQRLGSMNNGAVEVYVRTDRILTDQQIRNLREPPTGTTDASTTERPPASSPEASGSGCQASGSNFNRPLESDEDSDEDTVAVCVRKQIKKEKKDRHPRTLFT